MSSPSGKASWSVESAVERIRVLNERVVQAARHGGEESLRSYERLLENVAEAQEAAGERSADWIREFARAQATFTRQLAEAFPAFLQRVGARGKELGADASERARQVPGVAEAEGRVRGAVAREQDLPIRDYDRLTVQQINDQLRGLSEVDLRKVEAYEARTKNRKTVRDRISNLRD